MIVKVKQGEPCSWRFHDNAREVSYSSIPCGDVPHCDEIVEECEEAENGFSFTEDDGITHEIHFLANPRPEFCLLVSFIDHTGNPHNLYTDAETYLLNDSGKTIERIR